MISTGAKATDKTISYHGPARSYSSSSTFSIGMHLNNHRRDGSHMTDIQLCIEGTTKLEHRTFTRDRDLIRAFSRRSSNLSNLFCRKFCSRCTVLCATSMVPCDTASLVRRLFGHRVIWISILACVRSKIHDWTYGCFLTFVLVLPKNEAFMLRRTCGVG